MAQVLAEHADGLPVRALLQLRAQLGLQGGLQQPLPGILRRRAQFLGEERLGLRHHAGGEHPLHLIPREGELHPEHLLGLAPEQRQDAVGRGLGERLLVGVVGLELGRLTLLGRDDAGAQAPPAGAQLTGGAAQGRVLGHALGADVPRARERGGHVRHPFLRIYKGPHLRLGIFAAPPLLLPEEVRQGLQPALPGDRGTGAALGLVRQVQVLQLGARPGLLQGLGQLRRQLPLALDGAQDGLPARIELGAFGGAIQDGLDLHLVEASRGLLAVAGDEGHGGPLFLKREGLVHLLGPEAQFPGQLDGVGVHGAPTLSPPGGLQGQRAAPGLPLGPEQAPHLLIHPLALDDAVAAQHAFHAEAQLARHALRGQVGHRGGEPDVVERGDREELLQQERHGPRPQPAAQVPLGEHVPHLHPAVKARQLPRGHGPDDAALGLHHPPEVRGPEIHDVTARLLQAPQQGLPGEILQGEQAARGLPRPHLEPHIEVLDTGGDKPDIRGVHGGHRRDSEGGDLLVLNPQILADEPVAQLALSAQRVVLVHLAAGDEVEGGQRLARPHLEHHEAMVLGVGEDDVRVARLERRIQLGDGVAVERAALRVARGHHRRARQLLHRTGRDGGGRQRGNALLHRRVRGVDVPGDEERVLGVGVHVLQQLLALGGEPVPPVRVEGEALAQRGVRNVRLGAQIPHQRRQRNGADDHLPGVLRGQPLLEPGLLGGPQHVLAGPSRGGIAVLRVQIERVLHHDVARAPDVEEAHLAHVHIGHAAGLVGGGYRRHANLRQDGVDVRQRQVALHPGLRLALGIVRPRLRGELDIDLAQRALHLGVLGRIHIDVGELIRSERRGRTQGRQGRRIHHHRARIGVLGDEVVRPIGAVIGHDEPQVLAELEVPVDAGVREPGLAAHVDGPLGRPRGGGVDGDELEERLLRVAPPVDLELGAALILVGRMRAPAVVGELVVIPHDDEGVALVNPLQDGIRAEDLVEVPVVGERRGGVVLEDARLLDQRPLGLAEADAAQGVDGLEGRVPRRLVHVVPEEHHEVQILVQLQQPVPRVVVTAHVVLAAGENEPHRHIVPSGGRGAGPAHRGGEPLAVVRVDEAVIIGGARLEVRHLHLDGMVVRGARRDRQLEHERAEGLLLGHIQRERRVAPMLWIHRTRPQHHAVGPWLPRGHRLGEIRARPIRRAEGRLILATAKCRRRGDRDDGLKEGAAMQFLGQGILQCAGLEAFRGREVYGASHPGDQNIRVTRRASK
ncbi:hypothetical protein STIAU_2193 [Stigmatella aurantiaca DW4/3-1]|uniref:Uncharacterized protein n=1 Tax=Stigmatella aurantiaca (strain DW4/3-1) TaxID=378806 RepID=Q08Y03_STIAD|nr:hypothetical protein STIAU_2193 [Stigmatella aurantiaca DW4/3-1]